MQRISCINRRHSSTIEATTPSLILHAAARAMISDMRATYSTQRASRSCTDDAPDSDLKSRRESNPPSSSTAAAALHASSSSSSSSSSRTPKRASQGQNQGQSASKWGCLDLSASSSTSILTSSYDYDDGGGGDDSGFDIGYSLQSEGREGSSTYNRTESDTALFERAGDERHDEGESEGNEETTHEPKNGKSFATQNPSGALEDSNIPLEEDFGEYIGGSSNSLFSPLQQKSRKSSENSKAVRAEFNKNNGASGGMQGAGSHSQSHSGLALFEESKGSASSAVLDGSRAEESVTDLYDMGAAGVLDIAAQSAVKKIKKSKRIFPATPDTDKKTKKRRKSEKDSIDDIFGDI